MIRDEEEWGVQEPVVVIKRNGEFIDDSNPHEDSGIAENGSVEADRESVTATAKPETGSDDTPKDVQGTENKESPHVAKETTNKEEKRDETKLEDVTSEIRYMYVTLC